MTRFSLAVRTTNVTDANATLEIIAAAAQGFKLVSLEISLAAATASVFGFGRPAATGITPTTPVTVLADDLVQTGVTTVALAWGTGPTIPTAFIRRAGRPATVGSTILWAFDKGLWVAAGKSVILWNLGGTSAVDVNIVVEEQDL
jgi:hypothetical protein